MKLIFDARWIGEHGIGRFAREVRKRLQGVKDLEAGPKPSSPFDPAYLAWKLAGTPADDVFFSPGYNAPLFARAATVFTIHDLTHIESPETRTRAKALYYRHFVQGACHRAMVVLTVSDFSQQRICEWSGLDPARVVNVGNGVDARFTPEGDQFQTPRGYVFVVGNRRPHKNEARTLSAFASVAHRIPHEIAFLGEPDAALLQQASAAGVESRLRFLGRLTDEELALVYRGADAVLFASLHEGFGLPVVEAQACGTPVITSASTSLPEIAGEGALFVDPRSEEAIADATIRILSDGALRSTLVRNGLENARRFTWERTAGRVLQAIAMGR